MPKSMCLELAVDLASLFFYPIFERTPQSVFEAQWLPRCAERGQSSIKLWEIEHKRTSHIVETFGISAGAYESHGFISPNRGSFAKPAGNISLVEQMSGSLPKFDRKHRSKL